MTMDPSAYLMFDQLAEMGALVVRGDWSELEERFRHRCREADAAAADLVRDIDLRRWSDDLTRAGHAALTSSREQSVAAVYWEFDPDNKWDSAFFLCREYRPLEAHDDDWASDYVAIIEGPRSHSMSAVYDPGFDRSTAAAARNLYLFARTFAAFGRAFSRDWPQRMPLCAGHHDQSQVFRVVPGKSDIREGAPSFAS